MLPKWLMEAPSLVRGDDFYMRAFWELSSCRHFGSAIGPVPWNYIVDYGSQKGLDPGMMEVFAAVIREIDESYLRWQREAQKARRTQK